MRNLYFYNRHTNHYHYFLEMRLRVVQGHLPADVSGRPPQISRRPPAAHRITEPAWQLPQFVVTCPPARCPRRQLMLAVPDRDATLGGCLCSAPDARHLSGGVGQDSLHQARLNNRSSTFRVATLFTVISHEAGNHVKQQHGVNVGAVYFRSPTPTTCHAEP